MLVPWGPPSCSNTLVEQYKTSVSLGWTEASQSIRTEMTKIFTDDEGPAGTYYKACLDVERIDKQGKAPLEPWLKAIDAITDKESLVKTTTQLNKEGMDILFSWSASPSPPNQRPLSYPFPVSPLPRVGHSLLSPLPAISLWHGWPPSASASPIYPEPTDPRHRQGGCWRSRLDADWHSRT